MTISGCGLDSMLTTSYCFHSWVDPLITKPKQNKRKQNNKQINKQKKYKAKTKTMHCKAGIILRWQQCRACLFIAYLHCAICLGDWVNPPLLFLFIMTVGEAGCVTSMWHRGQRIRGFMFEPYVCIPYDITQWGNLMMHFSESVLVVKQYTRIDS